MLESQLNKGINIIREYSNEFPSKSGIYKMIASNNEILYVGKAKNLSKRVKSYANPLKLNFRLQKMISLINKIDFIITKDEAHALLLEASLIKEIKPKFNILLKDDKSYPYIVLRRSHKWTQVKKHRGKKVKGDKYFGPFASVYHVNNTLDILQKIFPIRTCSDYEIENRKRPCIQYQIKRCTAPCTNLIKNKEYDKIVSDLNNFLMGKGNKVLKDLLKTMNIYSKKLEFEKAAAIRDKIRSLEKINHLSNKVLEKVGSVDIFCITKINDIFAIEVIFLRYGRNFGSNTHYPYVFDKEKEDNILNKFIAQFYNYTSNIPNEIYVSHKIKEKELLEKALSIKSKNNVKVKIPNDKNIIETINYGIKKAEKNLAEKISKISKITKLNKLIEKKFDLKNSINKIEVYDNSHFAGKEAVGSYIVADDNGFLNNEYRKFNIKEASTNDDYGMMKEVLSRRLKRAEKDFLPDLIIVDGGPGQLSVAKNILQEYNIKNVSLISISKGKFRNSNNEVFYNFFGKKIILCTDDPVFYYLQRLRDEAHRFAINNHRIKRKNNLFSSQIDNIENIGPKRKKNLLLYFGSVNELKNAKLDKIEQVPGISKKVAKTIYNYFR